ncbi:hypothetical protein MVEN_02175700 [Mycena venus]|uniref:TPR-like protein n=1 Tax=Mycena venus TaxID=2733690 RepID=A0A8H6X972_9AGAR|nr:hypothetical protein MVEN_02175700 [Mycena venus]
MPEQDFAIAEDVYELSTGSEVSYLKWVSLDANEEEIERLEDLSVQTPRGHPDFSMSREMLADAYVWRYSNSRDPAVANAELSEVASFRKRCKAWGSLELLEQDMLKYRDTVAQSPADSIEWARLLLDLGVAFRRLWTSFLQTDPKRRSACKKLQGCLEIGICVWETQKTLIAQSKKFHEAVDRIPLEFPEQAGYLQDLAVAFSDRYQRLNMVDDLEAATRKYLEALDLTPGTHPDRAGCLQGLSTSLKDRYLRFGVQQDLDSAIQTGEAAVKLVQADHPHKANYLQSLAALFAIQYETGKNSNTLKAVHMYYAQSFELPIVDVEPFWHAAISWASFANAYQPSFSSTAYETAFNLLPEIAWIGHAIPHHEAFITVDYGGYPLEHSQVCPYMHVPLQILSFLHIQQHWDLSWRLKLKNVL